MTDGGKVALTLLGIGGVAALIAGIAVSLDSSREAAWLTAEKKACKRRGRRHLGGPGRDDCEGGTEVKYWTSRPVHAGVIRDEAEKGRREVVSAGGTGFTWGAADEAERLGIALAEQ